MNIVDQALEPQMKELNEKPLSYQERIFARSYVKNKGIKAKAAKDAYNTTSNNSAAVMGNRVFKKLKVQCEIIRVMQEQGLTDDFMLQELAKVAKQDGDITNKLRALDMGLKVRGAYDKNNMDKNLDQFLAQLK